jgi:hypothetical protein
MRWAVYVARMGEKRNAYRILVGVVWTGLIWLRIEIRGGLL